MEKQITEQESLRIINEMIMEARNDFSQTHIKPFVFMGWATICVAVLNIILIHTLTIPSYSFFAWLLMIPFSLINRIMESRREKRAKFVTHIGKTISAVWDAFLISLIVLLITVFSIVFIAKSWQFTAFIMPSILSLLGLAMYVTSIACKFKPYRTGAILFWLGALLGVCLLLTPYFSTLQFVILIICMLLGFILPSLQLKKV